MKTTTKTPSILLTAIATERSLKAAKSRKKVPEIKKINTKLSKMNPRQVTAVLNLIIGMEKVTNETLIKEILDGKN